MYDIRQFKPALYSLLILGFCGFAVAFEAPLLWVVAVAATLFNARQVRRERFRPLPRLAANALTVAALGFVIFHSDLDTTKFVASIAQFLVLLQIVKLYEQRANRDYGQLLVLSLLMMVAACISTASLWFALLLAVYLCLSLYCCLLFHLKVETDHSKQAIGLPAGKANPATLRQDEHFLGRSMLRLTALIAAASIAAAVVVFLFFPRNRGAGMLANLQFKSSQTLMGFKPEVSFEQIAAITHSDAIVAHVRVWKNDQPIGGAAPLILRGITLDVYGGNGSNGGDAWTWARSARTALDPHDIDSDVMFASDVPSTPLIRQEVTLQPTGTLVLFAEAGPVRLRPGSIEGGVSYSPVDEVLQLKQATSSQIAYEVDSTGTIDVGVPRSYDEMAADYPERRRWSAGAAAPRAGEPFVWQDQSGPGYPPLPADGARLPGTRRRPPWRTQVNDEPTQSVIDPQIASYARRPDVSGTDATGPLAAQRDPKARVTPLDATIAASIERHLRSGPFSYTLDLTDTQRPKDIDPLVYFLYTTHRGHCEYFAGAMTLLCQSLGLQARVCVGFHCDEFNSFLGAYIVRQSHAHAWVEVLDDQGHWESFDPTSARGTAATVKADTFMSRVRHLIDFLDFTWAKSVIAYDADNHASVVQAVNNHLLSGRDDSMRAVSDLRRWFESIDVDAIAAPTVDVVMTLFIITLVGAITWYVVEQWLLRRRARRIGLEALPSDEQLRLARQLGFYDELVRLLERHHITRPGHLTPLEFSGSISFLPRAVFDSIGRLTLIFYRIRYGRRALTQGQLRHLDNVIARIATDLRHGAAPRLRRLG